jgi:hypothetical protein
MDTKLFKERAKGNVQFAFFRDNELWYEACDGWRFPVHVSETGNEQGNNPTFDAEMKGITMMRWIRKEMLDEENMATTAET